MELQEQIARDICMWINQNLLNPNVELVFDAMDELQKKSLLKFAEDLESKFVDAHGH